MSETSTQPAASSGVAHIRWEDIPVEHVNPLFDRQLAIGDKIMVARILIKKGCVVPLHQHHNEQVSHVRSGSFLFHLEGREITLGPGEFLCIPPNVPHSAVALEDTEGIDIFTPPREDWINKSDDYLRK